MDILEFAFPLLLVLLGLGFLIQGGNWTIDAAVFVARRFGLSPMVVGFTVLAFGTSLPELVVSILAVLRGSDGIAMGNVIGSNIANILVVIGVAAFISTLHVQMNKGLAKDLAMMLFASFLLLFLMEFEEIGRVAGIFMLLFLMFYVFMQYRMAVKGEIEVEEEALPVYKHPAQPYLFLLLGLIGVSVGAEFLVRGASQSAGLIGVPEDVIALSIVALGTSLPELSTSIISARKGHSEMALGNVVGSNVFNILVILGATSIVEPIQRVSYSPQLLNFDVCVMLAVSVVFAGLVAFYRKINRPIGVAFIAFYAVYTVYIYLMNFGF